MPAEVYKTNDEQADFSSTSSQETVEGGILVEPQPEDMFAELQTKLRKVKSEHKVEPRKTMSKIIAGKELTTTVLDKMKEHESAQSSSKKQCSNGAQSTSKNTSGKMPVIKKGKVQPKKGKKPQTIQSSQQPGPSRYVISDCSSSDEESVHEDSELCCCCKMFYPDMSKCTQIILVKWGRCDKCDHWVHLTFCTPVRVIRLGDTFLCPCCVM